MLTVLEAIKLSTEYLEKYGIESPRTNAELLLAEILGCKRLDLYLSYNKPLKEDEISKYREFISRRSKGEPLQYILGYVEFYGLKFYVNSAVLIPRQETEILIETALQQAQHKSISKILDIGTGSGNISIAMAKQLKDIDITAIDNSMEALAVAKKNAEINEVSSNITFAQWDIFKDFEKELNGKYDLIISNPPYVSWKQFALLQKEIVMHEPKEAVTDFSDGFKYFNKISEIASDKLNSNGMLFFEVGEGQADAVEKILSGKGFVNIKIVRDYLNINRVVYGELG